MKFITFVYSVIIYLSSSFIIAEGKIYTWIDENGKSHFSDNAPVDAKEVILKETNLVSDDRHIKKSTKPAPQSIAPVEKKKNILYQVSISNLQNEPTIRANNGSFPVNVAISPELEEDHKFQLYIDNVKVGEPQVSTTILAENVDRGTHQIQVFLIDKKETVVAKTKIITVHIQRVSNVAVRPEVLPVIVAD